jgi:hypothetical protein
MSELVAEEARKIFHYDPIAGTLAWAETLSNAAPIGKVCSSKNGHGYVAVKVYGKSYAVHRIAWMIMMGSFPPVSIDHINRDRADNRWANLRLATTTQQCGNTVRTDGKVTGVRGVRACGKSFQARIRMKNQQTGKSQMVHLGTFPTIELAKAAYDAIAKDYFGEFYQP